MDKDNSRLGPVEAAIADRNKDRLMKVLRQRAVPEVGTRCLRWTGNMRPNGYGMVGHGRTNHLVHRLVAWADAGFPGEIKQFPSVHHLCGTRDCLRPSHLRPVTAFLNVLEARLRSTLLNRIAALEAALRQLAPGHPLLTSFPEMGETALPLRRGREFESTAERLRRLAAKNRRAEQQQRRREFRFGQVREVQRLREAGRTTREALLEVGIHRRVYQYWQNELRIWLGEDAA